MRKAMSSGSTTVDGARTLRRGLRLFALLRDAGDEGLHVVELAGTSGMPRPTVYRLLAALADEGLVERLPAAPVWRARAIGISPARSDHRRRLVERLRPAMRRISEASGDSTFLIVRDGDDSLCLHREIGDFPVQVLAVTIGHRQPMGVGAAGLAFLGALPAAEANAVIERSAARLGDYSGMTAASLRRLVDNTRIRGWAVVGNASVQGVLGVGVARLDRRGQPQFAVSVSSLIDRMPLGRQRRIAALIGDELVRTGR